jgi:hypothetical protein
MKGTAFNPVSMSLQFQQGDLNQGDKTGVRERFSAAPPRLEE